MSNPIRRIAPAQILALGSLFLIFLPGCAFNNAGIRHYERVTSTDAKGKATQRMALADVISADLPGLKTLEVGRLKLEFSADPYDTVDPVFDTKGAFVQAVPVKRLPGICASPLVKTQGAANRSFLDGMFSGITGTASSIGALLVTGGLSKALVP